MKQIPHLVSLKHVFEASRSVSLLAASSPCRSQQRKNYLENIQHAANKSALHEA